MKDKMTEILKIFNNFDLTLPDIKPQKKKYFQFRAHLPSGETKILKKIADLVGYCGLTKYEISLLTRRKKSEIKGVRISRV
jgi:hypothetical protein